MSIFRILALVGMASLSLSVAARANQPAATAVKPTVPAADRVDPSQARRDLAPLASAFGVKNPDGQTPQQNSNDQSSGQTDATPATGADGHKTLADVADRALTSIQDLTAKIADSLEKIAPQVWRIMIKQQIAKAIVAPLDSLGWLAGALVLWGIGHKTWKRMNDPDYERGNGAAFNNGFRIGIIYAIPIAVATIATMFLIGSLQFMILHLVNPEFYAIQDLLQAVMKGTPPT